MAIRDLEAFLRQSASNFDPNLDTTPGSPFDNKVIQPLVQRLGIDPFSVDLQTFLVERLRQAYPMLATGEGDNITDLLVKPATLLWDPIVREVGRVRRNLSFLDPTTLTNDEADSLGGNFFVPRRRGSFSRGTARILFSSPQQITVTQNNFVTSRGGLVYFPTSVQSIRSQEMLINVTSDGLYYFDISIIASSPGLAYDIDPNELTAVANLPAAARVTNLARFKGGLDEETPVDYAGRLQQGLGEKSLVSLRGVAAKLLEGFPDINRLNAIGFNDPEMQRDVIEGGGTGPILASGVNGQAVSDGGAAAHTMRFYTDEADFDLLIGGAHGFVLTVFGAAGGVVPAVDIDVKTVVDPHTIDLEQVMLLLSATGIRWTLRRKELTLSKIPGGILFPNTANGELLVPSGTIHIGGAYDTYVRAATLDDATFTIQNIVDDVPALSGTQLLVTDNTGGGVLGTSLIALSDYVLSGNYLAGDEVDTLLRIAEFDGFALQLQNGPNAGTYRILEYFPATTPGSSPILRLAGTLAVTSAVPVQWRLFDVINVNLVEPKETRVGGPDLVMIQGVATVHAAAGLDYRAFGVAKGDTLRVLDGPNAGDYTLTTDPLVPTFDRLQLDRAVPFSSSATKYFVFRPEKAGLQPPFVRIKSVELLDSTTQPQGSFIPYAKPIDVQSRSFQNPARGVKHDFREARVGLVSAAADSITKSYNVVSSANSLLFYFSAIPTPITSISIVPGIYTVAALVASINTSVLLATGLADVAVQLTDRLFGIRPVGNGFVAVIGGTGMFSLFGGMDPRTTADIRTDDGDTNFGWWGALMPSIDTNTGLDVIQVIDGRNVGFYAGPFLINAVYGVLPPSRALLIGSSIQALLAGSGTYFAPDAHRHVLIGARSIGSVRVYFLDPTTFEVNADTVFALDTGVTGVARFVPDPTMEHQQIPPLPNGTTPSDGLSVTGGNVFTSASQDFLLSGINPGDRLYIETHPLAGTLIHGGATVANVAGTTFTYSIKDGTDRTLVFIRDDPTIPADQVTKASLLEQINASVGVDIASYDGANHLTFRTDLPFVIRASSTALLSILGSVLGYTGPKLFSDSDTSNESPHFLDQGYLITDVGQTTLTLYSPFATSDVNWPATIGDETFHVSRSGVQRINTTQMAANTADAGLYYADIELVSEGAGDFWNIEANQQLTASGYRSDGYYLTTDDSNLTFSPVERPQLVLSRAILEQGTDDDPRNATQLSGQSLQVRYERSDVVSSVQDFLSAETERVVCASPLSRHLIPHFVRFTMEYFGGSTENIVTDDVDKYIREIFPVEGLDASRLQKIAGDRGATKVTNPITMVAIVHYIDRSVYAQRSQNTLKTGRLNAFIPDQVVIKRNISGSGV